MGSNEKYLEYRAKAVEWLNSKRDFTEGLTILQRAGYKPTVTANISKWGKDSKLANDKLQYSISQFVRMWSNPEAVEHQDEDPTNGTADMDQDKEPLADDDINKLCDENGYPDLIRRSIHEFYALLKERSTLAKEALAIDGDDEESNELRNTTYERIESISNRMDQLWKVKELFEKDGTLPSEDFFSEKGTARKVKTEKVANADILDNMDLEALKKLKKNEGVKLTRARNMLEYQTETQQDKPSPMPEGAKRVKYEKKVKDLNDFIEQISIAIAKKR